MKELIKDIRKYYDENKTACIMLMILAVVIFFSLSAFNFKGHDYTFHIQRIGSIAEEFKTKGLGAFPLRIYTTNMYGYGYGTPLFYGDIFLYPFALLTALGLNAVYSYRIMTIVLYMCCFLSMYFCAKKVSKDVSTSVICAVLYVLSSYFSVDLLIRSAIGECFSFVFLPIASYGFYCLVINPSMPRKERFFLVAGMAGMLLSHIISTTMLAIFMAIFAVVFFKRWIKDKSVIKDAITIVLSTVCICAFFFFPLLEQLACGKFRSTEETYFYLQHWGLKWEGWIAPHEFWKMYLGEQFPQIRDGLWFPGGHIYITLTLVVLYAINFKKLKKPLPVAMMVLGVLLIFWGQGLIFPLDKAQPLLGFMQFPYRIMMFSVFFMSIFGAYMVYTMKKNWISMILVIVSIISFMIALVPMNRILHVQAHGVTDEYTLQSDNVGCGEYIPWGTIKASGDGNFNRYCSQRGGKITGKNTNVINHYTNDEHGLLEISFSGNTSDTTYFDLPLLYYKGYSAVDKENGKRYKVTESDEGLVRVNIDDVSEGDMTVTYTGTPIQRISDIISIITILLLLVYFIKPEWIWAAAEYIKKRIKIKK